MCLFGHQRGYGEMQFPIKSARKENEIWTTGRNLLLVLKKFLYILYGVIF